MLGSPSTEKYEESGNFFFQFTEKEKHRALKNVSWKIKIIVTFEEKPNITNQNFYLSPGLMSYVTCIINRNYVLMKIWNKHN